MSASRLFGVSSSTLKQGHAKKGLMTVNELSSFPEPALVVVVDSMTTGVARQHFQDCQSTSDDVA